MSAPADLDLVVTPTLAALEAAVVARLMEQHTTADPPGPLVTVEPFQSQLAKWLAESGFLGPAVLVHFNGGQFTAKSTNGWNEQIDVQLFLGVVNYRGTEEARTGVGAEVGAYGLKELIFTLFAGFDLGLAIKPLEPIAWHSIIDPEDRVDVPFSLYRFDLALTVHRARPLAADVAAAVTHLTSGTTLDLEGGPTGDDDGTADLPFDTAHPSP